MHCVMCSCILAALLMIFSLVSGVPFRDLELASRVAEASLGGFQESSVATRTSTPKVHEPVASPATTAPPSPDATPKVEKRDFFHSLVGPETNQSFGGPCGGTYHKWPGKACQWVYPGENGLSFFDPEQAQVPTLVTPLDDITDVTKPQHDPVDPCNESRTYATGGLDLGANFVSRQYDVSERYLCCRLCHESELNCVAAFFDEIDAKCRIYTNHSPALPINFRHDETHMMRKTDKCSLGIFDVGYAWKRNESCPAGRSLVDHGTASDSVKECEGYLLGPCWTPFRDDFPFSKQGMEPGYLPLPAKENSKWIDEENPYGFHYNDPRNPRHEHHLDKYAHKDDYKSGDSSFKMKVLPGYET